MQKGIYHCFDADERSLLQAHSRMAGPDATRAAVASYLAQSGTLPSDQEEERLMREAGRFFQRIGGSGDMNSFCRHSFAAAMTAKNICEFCPPECTYDTRIAFVAGLMHDVGARVLQVVFQEQSQDVNEAAEAEGLPVAEAEMIVLGIDHGSLSEAFVEGWGLPTELIEAIRWHHQPGKASLPSRRIVQAVHLAEVICCIMGIGDGGDGPSRGFSHGAWYDLGLATDDIPSIIRAVMALDKRAADMAASLDTTGVV